MGSGDELPACAARTSDRSCPRRRAGNGRASARGVPRVLRARSRSAFLIACSRLLPLARLFPKSPPSERPAAGLHPSAGVDCARPSSTLLPTSTSAGCAPRRPSSRTVEALSRRDGCFRLPENIEAASPRISLVSSDSKWKMPWLGASGASARVAVLVSGGLGFERSSCPGAACGHSPFEREVLALLGALRGTPKDDRPYFDELVGALLVTPVATPARLSESGCQAPSVWTVNPCPRRPVLWW